MIHSPLARVVSPFFSFFPALSVGLDRNEVPLRVSDMALQLGTVRVSRVPEEAPCITEEVLPPPHIQGPVLAPQLSEEVGLVPAPRMEQEPHGLCTIEKIK